MNKQRYKSLLPFSVIALATKGDVEAINAILKHYEGYICKLSARPYCDAFGNVHICVDEEMRRRLETKLITKTLLFDIT